MSTPRIDLEALFAAEQREAQIYQQWRSRQSTQLQIEDLKHLIAVATGSDGELRSKPVWIISHDGCTHLPMVDWHDAYQRLVELLPQLAAGVLGHGLLAAVRLLALVNNAHAFPDGNGRLGRFLFNHCLHRSGMPATCYLPLKSLSLLSHGGYEVRLREAELFGRWEGLIAYHCHTVRLIHRLGHSPSKGIHDKDQ